MWDTEDAIRVAEGAQQLGTAGLVMAPPTAPLQNDVNVWLDIAARLKSRQAWPLGQKQPIETKPVFKGGLGVAGQMQMGPQEAPNFEPQFAWLLKKERGDELVLEC